MWQLVVAGHPAHDVFTTHREECNHQMTCVPTLTSLFVRKSKKSTKTTNARDMIAVNKSLPVNAGGSHVGSFIQFRT